MRHFAWSLALLSSAAVAQLAIPPIARVTDQTGTLSTQQRSMLEQRLAAFEQAKGSQVAVLVLSTTQPETIEQYAIRVAEGWKLGRKGVDDGAILLIAKDDRALRIEVGYGLEGALPDATAKRIVDEVIVPRFREGDFAGGIDAGVDSILKVIEGEPLPAPEAAPQVTGTSVENVFGIGLFALFLSQALGRMIGKFPSAAGIGGLFGFVAYVVFGIAAIGVFAGVVLFIVSLFAQLGGNGGRRGGWISGGGGFRGAGGFGGGGGFRGGGGGFGGGGASGRW
ncbi:MAG TPA: YgcG family protein [Verrucomicrobiae bacterium]|nr:YgcG family protein [Verrucomicrobiae bacterium]